MPDDRFSSFSRLLINRIERYWRKEDQGRYELLTERTCGVRLCVGALCVRNFRPAPAPSFSFSSSAPYLQCNSI